MIISYRRKIISLVESAVIKYNRAVKLIDLQKYAESVGEKELCNKGFSTCLARLVYDGEIYIAKQGRRDKFGGNFYLPTGMEPEGYVENLPYRGLILFGNLFKNFGKAKNLKHLLKKIFPHRSIPKRLKNIF